MLTNKGNFSIMKITLGADPEFFIEDTKKKQFVSAHDLIKGTKDSPFAIPKKGFIQVDGVACEINTIPAITAIDFVQNILSLMGALKKQIKKKNSKANVLVTSTVTFNEDYFKNLPDNVKVLGCDPDYNAYTGEIQELPRNTSSSRSAGGHLHIGWLQDKEIIAEDNLFNPEHLEDCCSVVKQLDAVFWVLSYIWDNDIERRKTYGTKGAFRPKTFGVEYRTLSNQWLTSPLLMHWVFNTVDHCINLLSQGTQIHSNTDNTMLGIVFKKEPLTKDQITNYYRFLQNKYQIPSIPATILTKFEKQHASS